MLGTLQAQKQGLWFVLGARDYRFFVPRRRGTGVCPPEIGLFFVLLGSPAQFITCQQCVGDGVRALV